MFSTLSLVGNDDNSFPKIVALQDIHQQLPSTLQTVLDVLEVLDLAAGDPAWDVVVEGLAVLFFEIADVESLDGK